MSFKWSSGTTDARHFLSSLRVNRKRRQTNNPRFLNTSAEHLNILKKHDYVPEPYNSRIPISVYQKKEIHHFNLRKDLNWSIVFIIPRSFVFFFSYNIWKLFWAVPIALEFLEILPQFQLNQENVQIFQMIQTLKKPVQVSRNRFNQCFGFLSKKRGGNWKHKFNLPFSTMTHVFYLILCCCCIFPKMLISFRNWFFTHKIEIWNLLEGKHISMDLFSDNFHRRRIWHYIYILM